jgi:hypothetical protein
MSSDSDPFDDTGDEDNEETSLEYNFRVSNGHRIPIRSYGYTCSVRIPTDTRYPDVLSRDLVLVFTRRTVRFPLVKRTGFTDTVSTL